MLQKTLMENEWEAEGRSQCNAKLHGIKLINCGMKQKYST